MAIRFKDGGKYEWRSPYTESVIGRFGREVSHTLSPKPESLASNKTGRVLAMVNLQRYHETRTKLQGRTMRAFGGSDIDLIHSSEKVIHHEPQAVDIANGRRLYGAELHSV